MDSSLVTVVTITYNLIKSGREKYVRQAINCVFNQTYKNIEHIIIDGASNDGTLEIFKDYPHLKVFSEPDSGVYDAMNKGVKHANGKYIVFLNSDDFWHDNRAVEVSVKALEENNADFSYAPCKYLNEDDEFIGYLYPTIESFFVRMPFCHQTMFTKTNLVKFDTKYNSSGDFDFVLKLILSGAKGVFVPLNFTSYRWIGISSGKTSEFNNENCKLSDDECINSIYNNLSNFGLSQKEAKKIYNSFIIKSNLLDKITQKINPDLSELIKKVFPHMLNKNIKIDIIPCVRFIQVLFNARDLKHLESKKIIDSILSHGDCKLVLYSESDVEIPEEYKNLPLYEGCMNSIDFFCSPFSPVPKTIKNSNVPTFKSSFDLKYRLENNVKNILIKGKYKIKFGKLTLFNVCVSHGIKKYLLFKIIPVWKSVVCDGCENHYLFTCLKILELKN